MTGLSAICGTTTRRRRTALIALLVGLLLALGLTVSAGPAWAQLSYKFKNVATSKCMWESGTTSRVYAASCSNTNHSDYWTFDSPNSGPMKNLHSGKCLTTDTSFYNVFAAGCTRNNDYQRWFGTTISGNEFEIISYATGQCLWGVVGGVQVHLGNCSSTNHADLWTGSL